jgi:hypothetical protein
MMNSLLGRALGVSLVGLAAAWSPASAQSTARPGYAVASTRPAPFGSVLCSLADGGYLTFDGLEVARWGADGTQQVVLASLGAFAFPSFIRVDPTESFALLGESSTSWVMRLDLATNVLTQLTQLNFNYAATFDPDPSVAWISAALGGFGAGNDILRLDLGSGTAVLAAHVGGPSGPLVTSSSGDLYYGTQYDGWPVPPDTQAVIRWDAAELASGVVLSELDADVIVDQLDGTSGLALDEAQQALFVIDSDPTGGGENVLRRYTTGGVLIDEIVSNAAYLSTIEVDAGAGPMVFAPYQPEGAVVRLALTDYNFSFTERVELRPARPAVAFSGPTGPTAGPATVSVTGGPPQGSVVWMWTRPVYLSAGEWVGDLGWGVPTFYMADPTWLLRQSVPFPLDASGAASLTYSQPASMFAGAVFQARLLDASGAPVGTSAFVVND